MLKDDFLRTYLDRIQVIVVSLLPEAGLVHLGIGSLFIYAVCETWEVCSWSLISPDSCGLIQELTSPSSLPKVAAC